MHGSTNLQQCQNNENVSVEDDVKVANLVGKIKQKQDILNIDGPFERLSPNRSLMEKIATEHEKMQADLVNKNRARVTKTV